MKKIDDYQGHTISLNERHRFAISGPLFDKASDETYGYATWEDATKEIDERAKKETKEKTTNVALTVLMDDGSGRATIKGIHSRLGTLLFTDPTTSKKAAGRWGGPHAVYPDVQWIQDLLTERVTLSKRLSDVNGVLRNYEIAVQFDSYHIGKMDGYSMAIENLKTEYAAKLAAAQSTNDRGQKEVA